MLKERIYSKIAKELGATPAGVRAIAKGKRGKRGSELQDKVLMAMYAGQEIYTKADNDFDKVCKSVAVDKITLTKINR